MMAAALIFERLPIYQPQQAMQESIEYMLGAYRLLVGVSEIMRSVTCKVHGWCEGLELEASTI